MACQILVLLFAYYSIIAVSGEHQSTADDCLTKCTNVFYQSGSRVDPISMLNIESKLSPEGIIVECPRMNDSVRLEKSCGPYRTAKLCIDECPQSDAKTTLLNTWGGLQFICNDRIDDWKGYMPCLSAHCVEIQGACAPKCGSFSQILHKVVEVLREANNQRYAQNSTALNIDKFSSVFGESCSRLYCFNDCSREMTRNLCGNGAFALGQDIQWETLASMFYSLRQWGVNIEYPLECKRLAGHLNKKL